ncbi:serine hydrolase [Pseudoflavitalea sp. X16]|uniref:serine hydrolase domain-containing protein n=1 Tax=Paraflavitalea devenefica TaxID=2716334 RepID=UPI00141F8C30|nr:serine hydrolase [Paraflavitalea devenefica]NII29056.1 serine hydrolase [Paraflavitalea devenefica]
MHSRLLIVIFLLGSVITATAQDIVRDQGITSPFHQANTGKIIFTARPIALPELTPGDFLDTYELTNKSNLFMTVFMNHSLTNYMHRLAPGLSVDSLHKLSGYQFSLLVDGRLVYKSDILGAPLPAVRDTETVMRKPLIDNEQEGVWWTQFFWGRFLRNGGDSALTEGKHLLRLEIRPHVLSVVGDVIAAGDLNLVVNRKIVVDVSRIQLNRIEPYPGFAVSTESFDRNKIKELKGKIEAMEFRRINSIVVIKDGKLLIEEYFNGESRSSLHDPRSVGKSFASTMAGIAIGEGYLKGEGQTLKEFYPLSTFANYSPEKERVTLKDLLTMSAAFDGNDDDGNSPGNEENMYPTSDWVKFTLDLPVSATRPRGQWHYFTAGVVLLGDILNKTVPGGLEQYAHKKLFAPLGIQYQWGYTPQHVPNTAGGIRLNALDFAKYGQLYKNGGRWNGKQILPRQWVDKTFSRQLPIPGRPDEFYGYLFWNKQYTVRGKRYETYYCTGNGGNKIFVFKDQPLVIVITASAYGQPYAHPQVDRMMTDYILPAVLDK